MFGCGNKTRGYNLVCAQWKHIFIVGCKACFIKSQFLWKIEIDARIFQLLKMCLLYTREAVHDEFFLWQNQTCCADQNKNILA